MGGDNIHSNRIEIGTVSSGMIDSVLIANNTADFDRSQNTYNINYRFSHEDASLNVDVDYRVYRNNNQRYQPNQYYDVSEEVQLSSVVNCFDTPFDIDIATFKLDY
jgi:hypothetical protein